MGNIKGKAKIELTDINTGEVKEINENNLVTNALSKTFEKVTRMAQQPELMNWHGALHSLLSTAKMRDVINGLFLFEDPLVESVDTVRAPQRAIATAGRNYDLSQPTRGSLNTQESKSINDGKGYRFVWDFGTSNANCTFSALALTTLGAGDGYYHCNDQRSVLRSKNYNHNDSNTDKQAALNRRADLCTHNIEYIYSSNKVMFGDTIGYQVATFNSNPVGMDEPWNNLSWEKIVFENYTFCPTPIRNGDNSIIRLAKTNGESGKYYLLYIDTTSNTITDTLLLEGIPNTEVFSNFSMIKNNDSFWLLFNWRLDSSWTSNDNDANYTQFYRDLGSSANPRYERYARIDAYDVNAKVFTKRKKLFCDRSNSISLFDSMQSRVGSGYRSPHTVKIGDYFHSVLETAYSSNGRYLEIFNIHEEPEVGFHPNNRTKSFLVKGKDSGYIESQNPFGKSGMQITDCSYIINYSNYFMAITFDPQTLFTVNNMQTPITKTETNTMKITYELTWE